DFTQPVAVTMLGVVIFISDDGEAHGIVRRFLDALPSGSYLVLSHTITSPTMPDVDAAVAFWNEHGTPKLTQRTPEQVLRFFDGLELLEPGVVSCSRWRQEATPWGEPDEVAMFGGIGRKP
ncbi:MAG: SAM-dependent methyltransferase, partial [Pseudonocardiaceae bacterium]